MFGPELSDEEKKNLVIRAYKNPSTFEEFPNPMVTKTHQPRPARIKTTTQRRPVETTGLDPNGADPKDAIFVY